jgi:biotin carboxyl carrier protein
VLSDYAVEMNQYMPEFKEVDTSTLILAPMPGMLKSVGVHVGDQVCGKSVGVHVGDQVSGMLKRAVLEALPLD